MRPVDPVHVRIVIIVEGISPAGDTCSRKAGYYDVPDRVEASGDQEALKRYRDQMDRIVRMYPLRKLGVPQDIANMVVFLASDRANHITGQTISVNGGYCMP